MGTSGSNMLVIWLVTVLVMGVRSVWYDDMKEICGSRVDDLFYDSSVNDNNDKCRDLQTTFKCIKDNTNKNDWDFMVDTYQVHNMSVKIGLICNKESLRLCPKYAVQERMKQCYDDAGLPATEWTCKNIKKSLSVIFRTIACMKKTVRRCPDDDFIKEDLKYIDDWADQAYNCTLPYGASSYVRPSGIVTLLLAVLAVITENLKCVA